MNDFLKQDTFFFVTTVAVAVVTILLGVFLVYLIRIMRNVDRIAQKVRAETEAVAGELAELRRNIRSEGVRFKHFVKFFTNVKKKK